MSQINHTHARIHRHTHTHCLPVCAAYINHVSVRNSFTVNSSKRYQLAPFCFG